jgi:hypothetical protein
MGGLLATLMNPTRWKLRRSTLTPGARVQVRFSVHRGRFSAGSPVRWERVPADGRWRQLLAAKHFSRAAKPCRSQGLTPPCNRQQPLSGRGEARF